MYFLSNPKNVCENVPKRIFMIFEKSSSGTPVTYTFLIISLQFLGITF